MSTDSTAPSASNAFAAMASPLKDQGHRRAGGAEAFEDALARLRGEHRHQDAAPLQVQPGVGGAGVVDRKVAHLVALDADHRVTDQCCRGGMGVGGSRLHGLTFQRENVAYSLQSIANTFVLQQFSA